MAGFLTPVDIANRALQCCGAKRINQIQGFNEDSKNASETAFCYDKLRRSELSRNVWVFAIRRTVLRPIDANTMLLVASLWSPTTTYFVGSIVSDQTGAVWISQIRNNLANDPLTTVAWQQYFGPMTVSLYSATTTYFAGELVYTTAGDGTNKVYQSLQPANADNPATATAWDATVTYFKNQVVTSAAIAYMSKIDFNINQTPAASAADWAIGTTYAINNLVNGSDGITYKSLSNGNLGHDPTFSPAFWQSQSFLTPWTTNFVAGKGSIKWLQVGGSEFPSGVTVIPLNVIYPINVGPSTSEASRNFFRLPGNFMRMAPQDPKAGSTSSIGAPSELPYKDWNQEGDFIVTREAQPIMVRFVADVVDVTKMHDMFCEGLGRRIAFDVCEVLTQSVSKKQIIAKEYAQFMGDARLRNAIEIGAEQQSLDDYIACRN